MLKKFLKGIVLAGVIGMVMTFGNNYNAGRFSITISNLSDVKEKAEEISKFNYEMMLLANKLSAYYWPDEIEDAYSVRVDCDGERVIDTYFSKFYIEVCKKNRGIQILGVHGIDEKDEKVATDLVNKLNEKVKKSEDFKCELLKIDNRLGNTKELTHKNLEMMEINNDVLKEFKNLFSLIGIDIKVF